MIEYFSTDGSQGREKGLSPFDGLQLAQTIASGADLEELEIEEDFSAEQEIDDAVSELLSNDEMEAFQDYNGETRNFYRIRGTICVHWLSGQLLQCGTATEIAAADVSAFHQHQEDKAAEAVDDATRANVLQK